MTGDLSRWDWYEATLDAPEDGRVTLRLAAALRASVTPGKGRNGYARGEHLERDGMTLLSVYSGSPRLGEYHLTTTSESCDEVVPVIRERYLHRVSRADSAVDFQADWAPLDAQVLDFAQRKGLSYRLVTDSAGGATRYVGSPRSEVQVRVYRKTEQLRAVYGAAAAHVPEGIVRAEVQVRPGKRPTKELLACSSPDDAWGYARWSGELASELLALDAERTRTHFARESSWSRTSRVLAEQYGRLIRDRAEAVGAEVALAELAEIFGLKPGSLEDHDGGGCFGADDLARAGDGVWGPPSARSGSEAIRPGVAVPESSRRPTRAGQPAGDSPRSG